MISEPTKIYFSFNDIQNNVKTLANKIISSGIKYEAMIAISGGGLIPARLLRTYLNIPIYCMGVSLYKGSVKQKHPIVTQSIGNKELDTIRERHILIIDDLDDTRDTLAFVIKQLEIKYMTDFYIDVAVLYNKEKDKTAELSNQVNYYCAKEIPDEWVVFPWDTDYIEQ